jgi:hypothetical protein
MSEPQKLYAKWKKQGIKDHVVWLHLYDISKIDKSIETESSLVVVRLEVGGRGRQTA